MTPAADLSKGLHAKVFAWQTEGRAHVLTGSANCTGAAFGGNIELSVLLSGPVSACGVHALVGDDTSGFLRITQGYAPREVEPQPDPVYRAERMVELWHAELAAGTPRLIVTDGESGFDLQLEVTLPADPDGLVDRTTARPVGIRTIPFRPLAGGPSWRGLNLAGLTPYLAVSTTVDVNGTTVTKECVLLCEVVDAPQDRLARLLRSCSRVRRTSSATSRCCWVTPRLMTSSTGCCRTARTRTRTRTRTRSTAFTASPSTTWSCWSPWSGRPRGETTRSSGHTGCSRTSGTRAASYHS